MITRLLSCFVYWETWERRRQTRSPLWKSSVNFGYKIVGYPSYYFGNMLRLSISEPALELHSRAVPNVEAHYHVKGPNTGRNSWRKAERKHMLRLGLGLSFR